MATSFPIAWAEISVDWLGQLAAGEPPYVTLYGLYKTADGGVPVGGLVLVPAVSAAHLSGPSVVTQAEIPVTLASDGSFAVTVLSSDAPEWKASTPVPYIIREDMTGLRSGWMAYLNAPGPIDITTLVPLVQMPEYSQYLTQTEADLLYAPISGGAFPDSFDYVINDGLQSMSQTYKTVATLDINRPMGTYLWAVSLIWSFATTNRSIYMRFSSDGGGSWSSEFQIEPGDQNDRAPFTYQRPINHGGGLRSILMQVKAGGTGPLYVEYVHMHYQRVG